MRLLIHAYQVRGYHVAQLDPLDVLGPDLGNPRPPELELSCRVFGRPLTERNLEKEIILGPRILPHFATEDRKTMKCGEMTKSAREPTVSIASRFTLCSHMSYPGGAVGIQHIHIPDKEHSPRCL